MNPKDLRKKYIGVQVVMVTPFKKDFSLDEEGLRYNTNFLIENGVHVLQPCGSTGEFWSMTSEENKKTIKIVVEEAKGRVPVVPGTGHSGTGLAVEMSKYAEEVGADGVMIMPPYYQKPTIEGIYEHYKTVAEAINIGIVVYNNPWTTKVRIGTELMKSLLKIPEIVAVKETCGDMGLAYRLIRLTGDKLTYSMGMGEILAPYFYMSGAKGHVTTLANFAPRLSVEMYDAAMKKDWGKVNEIHFKLGPYLEFTATLGEKHAGTVFISAVKEAMNMLDLPGGLPRRPLLPLSDEEKDELREILKKLGLLEG